MHFVAEIRNYDFDDREVTVQLLFMDTNRPNRMKASFRVKLVHETPAYNKRNRASHKQQPGRRLFSTCPPTEVHATFTARVPSDGDCWSGLQFYTVYMVA